ncbi:unnamed protein product [Spirodela intermedia]|uniref:Uncharacterized protein n=1 Tax=Spirodela intermedia TaxID=51605 RepID=A0A7I8K2J4_SPIIN|nr:unnamed protein product [Spirodela intermedia]
MAFPFLGLLRGEPLVSKLAAVAQFVVYPSVMVAYCVYVPEEPLTSRTTAAASASEADKSQGMYCNTLKDTRGGSNMAATLGIKAMLLEAIETWMEVLIISFKRWSTAENSGFHWIN